MGCGLLAALLPFAVLCGYPIVFQLTGQQHLPLTRAFGNMENINSDLLSAIVPTRHELIGNAALQDRGSSYAGGDLPENGGYLGLGLLAVLGGVLVVRRRERLVRWCLLLALVAYAFSLGRTLIVDNRVTGIPMPFDVLWRLPLLSSELPARYSLLVALFAAVALAIGLDPPGAQLAAPAAPTANGPPAASRPSLFPDALRFWSLAAVALVPLVPRFGYAQPPTRAPAAFLASATARSIPPGSVVLTYPYNAPPWDDALLWQAQAGFPFRLIGGYGVTPDGGNVDYPVILPPYEMYDLFEAARDHRFPYPRFDRATFLQLRTFCRWWGVSTILVVPVGGDVRAVVRYLDAAFGSGRRVDGVDVWTRVQARALAPLPALRRS